MKKQNFFKKKILYKFIIIIIYLYIIKKNCLINFKIKKILDKKLNYFKNISKIK